MAKHKADDPLALVPLFSRVGPKERQEVLKLFTELSVDEGRVIIQQGKPGREFFIIESGTARVERDGEVLAEIGPGDYQGELALLHGGIRSATVTATTPMKLLVASSPEFNSLLDRMPAVARQMLPVLVERLVPHVGHTD